MKLKPMQFAIAAVICGIIAVIFANDAPTVVAAGATAGFSTSVGLLGIAAALAEKST